MQIDKHVDVAVVGGGLGGLSLAISLLRRAVPVEVFEQVSQLREIGAGVAIAANGSRLLQRLGLDLGTVANVPPDLEFHRWSDGRLTWSHEIGQWYHREMGAPLFTIHRGTLHRMLTTQIPCERIHLHHRLTRIVDDPDGVRLQFADQPDVVARIAIGADGLHSITRRYVCGAITPVYFGEIGFRGVIPTVASPTLPTPTALHVWCGPKTHVVYYGINDGRLVNLLAVYLPNRLPGWTQFTNRVPGTRAAALALFEDYGWDGRILDLIRHIEGDMHFWALQELPLLVRWSRERVVLIGDAAHAPLPHQGQGAGQAIEDAYVLAQMLAEAGPDDYRRVFDTYQRLRQLRTRRVQHYSRLSGRLFKLDGEAPTSGTTRYLGCRSASDGSTGTGPMSRFTKAGNDLAQGYRLVLQRWIFL
jgi:salicylate hydroxylase